MKLLKPVACAIGLLVMTWPASAALDLGAATDYNVFVFENFTAPSADTQGRMAIGGNFTTGSYAVINPDSPFYGDLNHDIVGNALIVGGDANINGLQVYWGDAIIGGNATIASATFNRNLTINGNATLLNGGTIADTLTIGGTQTIGNGFSYGALKTGTAAMPVDWAATQNYLTDYSAGLAAMNQTGSIRNEWGNLILTGGTAVDDMQVFNLTGDQLANNLWGIEARDLGGATTVVLNVDATTITKLPLGAAGGNSLLQTRSDIEVLYNFYNAESITLGGGFYGNFLAPYADVNGNGGELIGRLMAKSFSGGLQFNSTSITTPVPEPSEYLMIALGLAMIAFCVRKRRA